MPAHAASYPPRPDENQAETPLEAPPPAECPAGAPRGGLATGTASGTLDQVVRGEAAWCVVQGDALHVLRDLPDGCVSAFVTDPPYSSGGAFRGDRVKETTAKYVSTNSANREIPPFEGDVRDQRSFTLWTALWSSEAWRCGADGCHLVAFSDWRQLPASATQCRREDGCGEG